MRTTRIALLACLLFTAGQQTGNPAWTAMQAVSSVFLAYMAETLATALRIQVACQVYGRRNRVLHHDERPGGEP